MKWPLLLLLLVFFTPVSQAFSSAGVMGKVEQTKGCADKVMVWLSLDKEDYQERLLLLHTEVPVGGTFQFYLRPGNYQVRASDQEGCEFFKSVEVKDSILNLKIVMEKK